MKHIFTLILFSLSLCLNAAGSLPKPEGEVILEVGGAIEKTNSGNRAHFDRAMIEALPSGKIITSNHVIDKAATYTGPIFHELLKLVGAQGSTIRVTALDDYTAELSLADLQKYGVILATNENGKQLTLDDRGPFFVVFPFDEFKELQNDLYYNMSVWQVMLIEVE
jgi:hypothetical protein